MRDMGNQLTLTQRLEAVMPQPSPSGPLVQSVAYPDHYFARAESWKFHIRNKLAEYQRKGFVK